MRELRSKIWEALLSALPITLIVYILALTPLFNLNQTELITFSIGAVLLIVGIGMFNLGADLAMTPMGSHVGAGLSRQRKLGLLLSVCFVLGMLITIAEPNLQVLANQVGAVMNGTVLIYAVGVGVGAFLLVAILRIVFRKTLSNILMLFYMLLFALALMLAVNNRMDLLPMSFDSGGVASGPMTSGFILPLATGACVAMQGADTVLRDAFGVVALVAMTPLITIQLLGFRAIVTKQVKERRAMQRILDADDQQIIEFM
ncbi:MAG: DUF1538 domain-containing protein [Oscillospiraceae bacterium]|nr:DUF1538 domain-containing protein [Oscillospiraceae bacterium]